MHVPHWSVFLVTGIIIVMCIDSYVHYKYMQDENRADGLSEANREFLESLSARMPRRSNEVEEMRNIIREMFRNT